MVEWPTLDGNEALGCFPVAINGGLFNMSVINRATHGVPSERNSHPHRSDPTNEFTVVHNGIITNYKELRTVLEKFGYVFESDTDTEAVAKLAKFVYDNQKKATGNISFTGLVKAVCKELVWFPWLIKNVYLKETMLIFLLVKIQEGAFALIFKSRHFPGEMVAARRGSPLLIGVKTSKKLKLDFVDVVEEEVTKGSSSLLASYLKKKSFY